MNNQNEKLLREFIRKNIVSGMIAEERRRHKEELPVRLFVRSLIEQIKDEQYLSTLHEAKDKANPHPNTGINKLRDAIRKAKPSIKSKYQQLTTDPEQRKSFTNHFLTAMVRLFDELDALNAQGGEPEDVKSDFNAPGGSNELSAPPEDISSADMSADIGDDGDLNSILEQIDIDIDDDVESNDIVSDEIEGEKNAENDKNKTQAQKDFDKKSDMDQKRKDFGAGVDGDTTGRNQSFDAFNLVQSYFSDAYLDLNNPEDQEMFKKWGLYNVKLLLDKYEDELNNEIQAPNIENPS